MNFLGMGPMELLLIIILALIVFGPAKLPEIMGQVGKAINDFRRATSSLSDEFNRTIQSELQEGRSVFDETRAAVSDVHSSVNSAVTGMPAPTRTELPPAAVAAAAPNGISADLQAAVNAGPDPYAASTNGAASVNVQPALADTTQWSWETSPAPTPAPAAESPTADAAGPSGGATEPPTPAAHHQAVDGAGGAPAPSGAAEPPPTPPENPSARTARDDLLPPY